MTDEGQNLAAMAADYRVEVESPKPVRRIGNNGNFEDRIAKRDGNEDMDKGLYNDVRPKHIYTHEKPEHRKVLEMHMSGYTQKEIADHMGYCVNTVQTVIRQPWARKFVIEQTKKTVQQEMRDFLEAEVLPTLKVVVAVRDNEKARASDRLNASAQLLDRFLGKPVQPMTTETVDVKKLSSDELERQAAAIIGAGQTETTTA